ncbi:MAG: damage-inducible protein DinB [Spirochaetia bacterium]|jgi:uncharacterized damage-inducible protein DinB|nr:damage-inducible protein DinB [Spirochaetia bacterium]
MKKLLVMYARHLEKTNAAVLGFVGRLKEAERERDRGSYYKSLSGLLKHILGGTLLFQNLFRSALGADSKALRALKVVNAGIPEKRLDDAMFKSIAESFASADAATVRFARALEEGELALKVKLPWYGGRPGAVPLFFLFNQLVMHTVHHQGQISQILDELKVEHDFSGIDVGLAPKA